MIDLTIEALYKSYMLITYTIAMGAEDSKLKLLEIAGNMAATQIKDISVWKMGKKLQMLKRYLNALYNMTPEQYREWWSLSHDYPMIAPNYVTRRSTIAKDTGLGVKNRRTPGLCKQKVS